MGSFPLKIWFLVFLSCNNKCFSQALHTDLVARLPGAITNFASVYDGDDYIYMFGGNQRGLLRNDILRFSISSETVEIVGEMPSYSTSSSAQMDSAGNIFYFGRQHNAVNYTGVFKYDPSTQVVTDVTSLPYSIDSSTCVKYDEDSDLVYIFPGFDDDIVSYDMSTETTSRLGPLPITQRNRAAARVGRKAVIVGFIQDVWFPETRTALIFNLDNLQSTVGPTDFLEIKYNPSIVSTRENVYVIGGYKTDWATPTRTDGIVKLNPANFQYELIPVDNFPVGAAGHWLSAPGSVYVEKLDRIYMIGGYSNQGNGTYIEHDQVWKIDLNPGATFEPTTTTITTTEVTTTIPTTTSAPTTVQITTPTTQQATDTPEVEPTQGPTTPPPTTITCPAEGMHKFPHPDNCSLYIICIEGGASIYRCPIGHLFDFGTLECKPEDEVVCG